MATTALAPLAFDPDLAPIETLDEEIVQLTARMTAQEYELLTLIRSFDARCGWLKWGSTSCAEWLHWRCELSLSAAREKVRVAHALNVLPKISAAFAAGRLSYSKVRALTRVASATNEAELLSFALGVSAALVEQHCQQLRNTRKESTTVARRAYEQRALSAFRNNQKNTMMITVELPLEDGELLLNALDRVLAAEPQSADGSNSYRARQADALITLCRSALSDPAPADSVAPSKLAAPAKQSNPPLRGGVDEGDVVHCDAASSAGAATEAAARAPLTAVSTTANYEVVVHTDASALADRSDSSAEGSADRADLPIETIRRLCCDGSVVPISNGSQGQPLHIGRKRRTVSTALKRALLARDRHCQFPGCSHNRFVDAHHIQHWAHGGATSLENLMLLCGHHHRLMHEGGFQVVIDSQGRRAFRRPDGRCVPANGYRPQDHSEE